MRKSIYNTNEALKNRINELREPVDDLECVVTVLKNNDDYCYIDCIDMIDDLGELLRNITAVVTRIQSAAMCRLCDIVAESNQDGGDA